MSAGIPFPSGTCRDPADWGLQDDQGTWLPSQWHVLARWRDGSVRWALLDFLAPASGQGDTAYRVARRPPEASLPAQPAVEQAAGRLEIHALSLRLSVSGADGSVHLADSVGRPVARISLRLVGARAGLAVARFVDPVIETTGPVCTIVRTRASLHDASSRMALDLDARVTVWHGAGLVGFELCLRNPTASHHPGGLWDLGDSGSCLIREFNLELRLAGRPVGAVSWQTELQGDPGSAGAGPLEIYQHSSGGENWQAHTHLDRNGRVPLRFRGFRVRLPGGERTGLRASPVVSVEGAGVRISAAIEQFWQNFPRAMEADEGGIRLRLSAEQGGEPIELLPGEQKTHRAFVLVEAESARCQRPLDWVGAPRVFRADSFWYAASGVVGALPQPTAARPPAAVELYRRALEGPTSFFAKREAIDEYGWRHFGDVYADHENEYFRGERPVISHYNNQYDLLLGLLTRYLETGDPRWWELGRDLARHVIDIDLYHTERDRPSYNGGLFWHTDHYQHAHRAGHRTYSADSPCARSGSAYGGGPSNEHNYATGLLLYHYMSGDPAAREAVLSLADWVCTMDDGSRSVLGPLDPSPTGVASTTYSIDYHGPGRGAGNSISALLDGFALSAERRYLSKAEELIERCIHPADDIDTRDLPNLEARWSYLVFLQALGKYLDLKLELRERDRLFAYAEASLLAYARWMRDHEIPYRLALDRVEYPTATWPAHDLRKAVVFAYAAHHASAAHERAGFQAAAQRFRDEAFSGMVEKEGHDCTRPLAIVLQNEPLLASLLSRPALRESMPEHDDPPVQYDFGVPAVFEPQARRVLRMLQTPRGAARLAWRLLHPVRLLAFTRLALAEIRWRWP